MTPEKLQPINRKPPLLSAKTATSDDSTKKIHQILCCLDNVSMDDAIYIDGELFTSNETLYLADVCEACRNKTVQLQFRGVDLPTGSEWPRLAADLPFDDCP